MKRVLTLSVIIVLGLVISLQSVAAIYPHDENARTTPLLPLKNIQESNPPIGPGPDAVSEMPTITLERQHKRAMRLLANEWASTLQLDTLSDTELGKIDSIVWMHAYWGVFDSPQTKNLAVTEIEQLALDGQALKTDGLADAVTGGIRQRLYYTDLKAKKGGLANTTALRRIPSAAVDLGQFDA